MEAFGFMAKHAVEMVHYLEATKIIMGLLTMAQSNLLFNHLFDMLNDNCDYIVRIKHLRISNDKIYDLNVSSDIRKPDMVKT